MNFLKNLARKLADKLSAYSKPSVEDVISKLVMHTSSLELTIDEFVEFAPIKGCTGAFRLTGNSLPVVTYRVFEKSIMEFIQVRVEVARPDQIRFVSTIESTTAPLRNGEVVETKDKYKEPFNQLSQHLHQYFPYFKKPEQRVDAKLRGEK